MRTVSDAASGRTRLTAALALLALLLGAIAAGPRAGAAAGLVAATGSGEGWLVNADASQLAKVERGPGALENKGASGQASPPEQPSALGRGVAAHLQPPRAFAARPARFEPQGAAAAHRRPDPTGPPLLG